MRPRLIAIGGEPATGKSTLMRAVLQRLGPATPLRLGLARGYKFDTHWVLGLYEPGQKFPGTDRLSMAVQPDAVRLLHAATAAGRHVMFEGDRLFNLSFLRAATEVGMDVRAVVLRAPAELLVARHQARGGAQSSRFIDGRRTKVARVLDEFRSGALVVDSSGPHDIRNIAEMILS